MTYKDLYNLYYSHIIVQESEIDLNNTPKYPDYYLNLQDFYSEYKINSFICSHDCMDERLLIKTDIVNDEDVNRLFNLLNNNETEYINTINTINEDVKVLLDNEYTNLGFNGTFPKYYNDTARLEVNYDYMITLHNDEVIIGLWADCIRYVGENERHFKMYTGEYRCKLTDEVSCFVVYKKEVKYLEIIKRIINNNPKLPRWYKYENLPDRQLFRPFFFGSFVVIGSIVSILSYIFFKSNTIVLLIGLVLSAIISKIIGDIIVRKYRK